MKYELNGTICFRTYAESSFDKRGILVVHP